MNIQFNQQKYISFIMLLHVVGPVYHRLRWLWSLVRNEVLGELDSLSADHLVLGWYEFAWALWVGWATFCRYSLSTLHLWVLNLVSVAINLAVWTQWPSALILWIHPPSTWYTLLLKATRWHLLRGGSRSHIVVLLVLYNLLWTMDI